MKKINSALIRTRCGSSVSAALLLIWWLLFSFERERALTLKLQFPTVPQCFSIAAGHFNCALGIHILLGQIKNGGKKAEEKKESILPLSVCIFSDIAKDPLFIILGKVNHLIYDCLSLIITMQSLPYL